MLNQSGFKFNPTSQAYENLELETDISYRDSLVAFSKRKMNTQLLSFVKSTTGISKSLTFVFINFIYLLFSGVVLAKITELLFSNAKISLLAIACFYLNFTILLAFFAPLYSFDDYLQYFTLFLAFWALLKDKLILFTLFYLISILSRESSVFVAPMLMFFLFYKNIPRKKMYLGAILLTFILFYLYITNVTNLKVQIKDVSSRMDLFYRNFSTTQLTIESIYSWIIIFLIPLLLTFVNYFKMERKIKVLILLFWGITILNSGLVYMAGGGRETRLMMIPLILFLPQIASWLHVEILTFKQNIPIYISKSSFWISFAISFILSTYLASIHHTSIGITSEFFFKSYFFAYFFLFFLLFFQYVLWNKKDNSLPRY